MTVIPQAFELQSRSGLAVDESKLVGLNNPALPLYLIAGLPLYWVLGLAYFAFVIAAVAMAFQLLLMKPIRVPRGMGLWFLFLGWSFVSVAALDRDVTRYLSFTIRELSYLGATIAFLYVYNLPPRLLPTRKILSVLGGVFVFTAIIGGYLGVIIGEVRFPSLMSQVVPRGLMSNSFVKSVFNPPIAQEQDFLGFPLNRPSMPFAFTNEWGATLVPGTFIAIAWFRHLPNGRRWLVPVLALAGVPMIISANRGLWIALIMGVVYVTVRRASAGQQVVAIRSIFVILFIASVALVSPLGDLVTSRATSEHSFESRGDIYTDVIEAVPGSPLIGYGAPIANPNPNRPAIGTHGMVWTTLFSQGIPGLVFYAGFFLAMTIRTGVRIRTQEQLWLHLAVASALPTMFYYDHLPAALPLMMMAAALALRDRRYAERARRSATGDLTEGAFV